jgi:flagellar FliL protein
MASKGKLGEDDLNLDVQAKPAGKKQLILYGLIGLLVLALIGMGVVLFMMRGGSEEGEAAGNQIAEVRRAHYLDLKKMVVNLKPGSPARFLQVNLQVMSYDEKALKAVETHMPAIRNDVLLLLGSQEYVEIASPQGMERLLGEIQEKIQTVLDSYAQGNRIDAVYYTEFIMQ